MNYDAAVKRAWAITKQYRWMWWLGILGGGGGINFSYSSGGGGSPQSTGNTPPHLPDFEAFLREHMAAIVGVGAACLALGVALMFVSAICRGALVRCVWQIEQDEEPAFQVAWAEGVRRMWTVLGIGVTLGLMVMAYLGVTGVPLVMLGVVGGGPGIVVAVLLGILALMLLIPIAFVIAILNEFGVRRALVVGDGAFACIEQTWRLVRQRPKDAAISALIPIGFSMAAGIGVAIVLCVVAIPCFALAEMFGWAAGLIPGLLVALPVSLVASGALGTFTSSFWTLMYRGLTTEPVAGGFATPGAAGTIG